MSTLFLNALPGKLDITSHSSSSLYKLESLAMSTRVLKALLVDLISKDTHLVFSISGQALRCQQACSKPCMLNLLSKDTHLVFSILGKPHKVKRHIQALPGKRGIKRHSPSIVYI